MKTLRLDLTVTLLALAVTISHLAMAQDGFKAAIDDLDRIAPEMKTSQFPMRRIAECENQGNAYQSNDLRIVVKGRSLVLYGIGASSFPWEAQVPINGLGCQILATDFDRNGVDDLIILSPGIGDRGEYGSSLTILLRGRTAGPAPWRAVGHFTMNDFGYPPSSSRQYWKCEDCGNRAARISGLGWCLLRQLLIRSQ